MKKLVLFSFLILLFSGCATYNSYKAYHAYSESTGFNVYVDSYGNDSVCIGKTCVLVPEDTTIIPYDLQYLEFYNQIVKVFSDKGYRMVKDLKDADYVIYFKYGMSVPDFDVTEQRLPVWAPTGAVDSEGEEEMEIVGYQTVNKTKTKYHRYLYLTAYDIAYSNLHHQLKVVWQAEIESTGEIEDFRRVFPVLLAGSEKYIGHNSGQKQKILVYEKSHRVQELRAD
ncbi:hypothetical protein ACE1ET_09775 [Saccharicrinis sp. FJH62]|uniref:hypothetical protein n=1 Tax=Saccharicrinis sp. FJH62 TaxID=3344657 RepID=UPI0035D401B4